MSDDSSKLQIDGLVGPDRFDAVLFGLDDVLTTTGRMQASAWQRTFDEFLPHWDAKNGTQTAPFSRSEDYVKSMHGKPRHEGVRDFLASRSIELAPGTPESSPSEWSVWGIGNRKQHHVDEALREEGVEVFPGSVAWLRELRDDGLLTAVVTSSHNCQAILKAAGIEGLFDGYVDGAAADELDLEGKPAPDFLLEAARRLDVDPERTVVVENSPAGVGAGRAGGFALVIGVDRDESADELTEAGAHVVVSDLSELMRPRREDHRPAGPRSHRLRAGAGRLLAADSDFPVDEHRLVERRYVPEHVSQMESLFSLSNGYLGLRGAQDEGRPAYDPAPILNGFYETWPLIYPERAYGFAETGQTIVGVPDGSILRLYVDDDAFSLDTADILEYERVLDMRSGTVQRRVVWSAPDGRRFAMRSRRLVSFVNRHLVCIEYEVTSLDGDCQLTVSSNLVLHPDDGASDGTDPRNGRTLGPGVLQKIGESEADERVVLTYETRSSGLRMACGIDHEVTKGETGAPETTVEGDWARVVYRFDAKKGVPIRLVKYVAYHHGGSEPAAELRFRVGHTLDRARSMGVLQIFADQRSFVSDFWERSDVVTEGAPLLQQAVRFNLFQLLQASARVEGHGIPAKGLTGRGYEGHYFWDGEIYVMPFLTHTAPHLSRSLLSHRYGMLDKARGRAAQVGQRGALFPWRTINGDEASAYYAAGTAQYHIDADIAYAITQYVNATEDFDFLARQGAEILVETARQWVSLGFFSDSRGGRFVINGVTGPDEYSALVDNNTYTNLMAQENLRQAVKAVEWMARDSPEAYAGLVGRTGLQDDEVGLWRRAADHMYVPYDEDRGLYLQDDGFLDLERWDFENTPPENYPLLLHYHPLVLYRHQVIKQADVVLAAFLLGERFSEADKRRLLDYYDPLTTSDSSLSECIQSIMAAEVGEDLRAAEEYFVDAVGIDLADIAGNVRDGLHLAAAGGNWMALVYGFGGMRESNGRLSFRPRLPARMTRLSFKVRFRGSTLRVDVTSRSATYTVESGKGLTVVHGQESLRLDPGAEVQRPLASPDAGTSPA